MPTAKVRDLEMYYEEHGSGEPLLLIMGWGGNAASWQPQIPGLAKEFRVIAFDNRGSGRTSAPEGPYSVPQMADDTAALLDALDVEAAHVFGVSMGGMIAQELALAHPDRVKSLVLGCTSAGGDGAAGSDELQSDIDQFRDTANERQLDMAWFSGFLKRLWTDEALAQSEKALQDFVLALIRYPPSMHGLRHQAEAVSAHDTYLRLLAVAHPTLVMTGAEDSLIDPVNSEILAERIPGAELHVFPKLKHAFHLERPDLVNSLVVDFIQRSRGDNGRGPSK